MRTLSDHRYPAIARILFLSVLFSPFYFHSKAQQLEWVKGNDGRGFDTGTSIAVDTWGNVFTTGTFDDTTDFDPGPGTLYLTPNGATDIYIQKLNASGDLIWVRSFGGSSLSGDTGLGLTTDAQGSVYCTGFFFGSGDFDPGPGVQTLSAAGASDIFACKFDSSGVLQWAYSAGGTQNDRGDEIGVSPNGDVWIVGNFQGTADLQMGTGVTSFTAAGASDGFLIQLNPSGNFVFAGKIGGNGFDDVKSIEFDPNGNSFISGTFSSTADLDPKASVASFTSLGGWEAYLVKLSPAGDFIWGKKLGGTSDEYICDVEYTAEPALIITGRFKLTVDFDPGPGASNYTSVGNEDIFLAKFDTSGQFDWAVTMGSTGYDQGQDISIGTDGDIYLIGLFTGNVDFDPGPGTFSLTTGGLTDICVVKYRSTGSFEWAIQTGGTSSDLPGELEWYTGEKLYYNGQYIGLSDFAPGTAVTSLTSVYADDPFVSKLNVAQFNGIETIIASENFVYPNPANDIISVKTNNQTLKSLIISDFSGRIIYSDESVGEDPIRADISYLSKGVYLITLIFDSEKKVEPFIKW